MDNSKFCISTYQRIDNLTNLNMHRYTIRDYTWYRINNISNTYNNKNHISNYYYDNDICINDFYDENESLYSISNSKYYNKYLQEIDSEYDII